MCANVCVQIDPVFTCDGHTYEHEAIRAWLLRKDSSPLTGRRLENTELVPNVMARSLIREFVEMHPDLPESTRMIARWKRVGPQA